MQSSSERIKFIAGKIEEKNQLKMYSKAWFSTGKFNYFKFSVCDNLSAVLDSIWFHYYAAWPVVYLKYVQFYSM